jgi:hypothetical protein
MAGTTVTLDSSGGITLDADGGTITFADAGSSLGTITSSGYSGTSAVATVATTVTITDNENTDENNAIVFTAGGDVDGGNLGLESDGDLTYNPSSGTLNVPNISVTGTQTIVNSVTMNANNAVIFEGATADAHETTLSTVDATGDRTINLPNVSGTLPVLAAASATAITSTPEELNILDGVNSTAAELNIMDGGTSATSTTVADADRVVMNDNGTMVQVAVTDLAAYFDDEITAMPNLTSVGTLTALTVDNMAMNGNTLTTTSADYVIDASHDIILDADGSDIRFKDGGTLFGLVSSGAQDEFIIQSAVSDKDIILKGNDGGSTITAMTLDMSAAGAMTTNSSITAGTIVLGNTDTDTSNSGNVTLDFSANQNFVLTLTGNVTLVNPSTESVGQSGFIACIQDGTGGRTLTLGTDYESAGGAGITLTSTASATDLVPYVVVAANRILLGTPQLAFS